LTVGVPVFADTNGTITIRNEVSKTSMSIKDKTFNAYKVMNLVSDGSQKNYTIVEEKFKEFFRKKAGTTNDVSTQAKLDAFAVNYIRTTNIDTVAKELLIVVNTNNITANGTSGDVSEIGSGDSKVETKTISNLELGYYIIADKSGAGVTAIAAAGLGTTDPNLTINLKASQPNVDKQILHNEMPLLTQWGKVGDNQIGDDVQFRLIGTIPNSIQGYTNYKYIMHDTLDKGLTVDYDSIRVYVGEEKIDANKLVLGTDYTIDRDVTHSHVKDSGTDSEKAEKKRFDVNVDVQKILGSGKYKVGQKIYVYYNAKLNENAVIANAHNDNAVYLEYSNNPYADTTYNSEKVVVFDYT
ncbi:MAG: isopeptide-forming domain-containing fimbrial protein, partial [Clostridium sp.]